MVVGGRDAVGVREVEPVAHAERLTAASSLRDDREVAKRSYGFLPGRGTSAQAASARRLTASQDATAWEGAARLTRLAASPEARAARWPLAAASAAARPEQVASAAPRAPQVQRDGHAARDERR